MEFQQNKEKREMTEAKKVCNMNGMNVAKMELLLLLFKEK